ncbi:hypothetical protein PHISP_07467 [Aspergillus sp. HF37]|nr:hypothetical protein PHISP_07467 [Aspergillus sp. HF37]
MSRRRKSSSVPDFTGVPSSFLTLHVLLRDAHSKELPLQETTQGKVAFSVTLSKSEIENILKRNEGVNKIHDEKAAVNYFTFDEDQWVSYDDNVTF